MNLPNLWTQGQLFAFSALDGESLASNDFVGTLLGDKIGIRFYSVVRRELIVVNKLHLPYQFDVVLSDYLSVKYGDEFYAKIVYANTHLIIGTVKGNYVLPFVEGEYETTYSDDIMIQDSKNGEFTAFYNKDEFFAYAFGKSREDVIAKITKAKDLNIDVEIQKKIAFFQKYGKIDDSKYARLYNKCLSTMKTQLYSPEGFNKRIWSTPDRLPHKAMWLWDSVFHAIGFRNIDVDLAETLVLDLFDVQSDDGFIPHYSYYNVTSKITQPPVIAWGSYKVYLKSKNKEFLRTVFQNNKRFLEWCRDNRRVTDKELYTWNTQSDVNCRCDESGMDNSPRFDIHERLYAIDFSCFMANETRYMKKIAEELGDKESANYYEVWNNKIANDINSTLWCDEDGFYYDVISSTGEFHKVASVASFLPIFSGVCSRKQSKLLFGQLNNPETFYTEFPIPCISKKDATFGSDMWRGPVWINYNYMISEGLEEYDYNEFANEIIQKTVDTLGYWYNKNGTIYEYYDSKNVTSPDQLNRKGKPLVPYDFTIKYQTIREYGWSNTLLLDLIHNKIEV